MPTYIADIGPRVIRVRRIDQDHDRLVDTIPLPAAVDLRSMLLDAGWRPTGRKARGGWGSIFVAPAEDRPLPS